MVVIIGSTGVGLVAQVAKGRRRQKMRAVLFRKTTYLAKYLVNHKDTLLAPVKSILWFSLYGETDKLEQVEQAIPGVELEHVYVTPSTEDEAAARVLSFVEGTEFNDDDDDDDDDLRVVVFDDCQSFLERRQELLLTFSAVAHHSRVLIFVLLHHPFGNQNLRRLIRQAQVRQIGGTAVGSRGNHFRFWCCSATCD